MRYNNINFIIKGTEHHLERHYEIDSNKNYFLQYVYVSEEFYNDRFSHCLNMTESVPLRNFLLDKYGVHEAADDFDYLQNRTFTAFFRENKVDVPTCFKRTLSVRKSINELQLLKFNNYLMRDGKRLQSSKFFLRALQNQYSNPLSSTLRKQKTNYSWKIFFILLNHVKIIHNHTQLIPSLTEEVLNYNHLLYKTNKTIKPVWNFHKWLFKNIYDLLPIFSFYIYKVDKKIFKNTRGKSGKFTFIWKYVTSFKRIFLVMQWLIKELRLTQGKTLEERLINLTRVLTLTPRATWAFKLKKFSHNYVYRNSRHTLAETYRTATK